MKTLKRIIKRIFILGIIWWAITSILYMVWSYTPRFDNYAEQKKFADDKHKNIAHNDYLVILLDRWYFNSRLKSFLAVERYYPEQAKDDIDILRNIGWSYDNLGYNKKALEYYPKELEVFKRRYFKKEYPEKDKFSSGEKYLAEREEYKRIIKIHNSIAGCYVAIGKYEKAVEVYYNIIRAYSKDLLETDWREGQRFIHNTYFKIAKIYYKRVKNYEKAIDIYDEIKTKFPTVYITSRVETEIGLMYMHKGEKKKALKIFEDINEKYRNNPEASHLINDITIKRYRKMLK